MIDKFKDRYSFLSNFYIDPFYIKGREYKSVEYAYQSFKCIRESEHEWIRNAPTSKKAKYFGKKVTVRKNWDNIKYDLMFKLLKIKFENKNTRQLLLNTNNEELIEKNYWHDNYWGDCTCNKCDKIHGENKLGELLMKVRNEIKNELSLFSESD